MASEDDALDAVVDRILLGEASPSPASSTPFTRDTAHQGEQKSVKSSVYGCGPSSSQFAQAPAPPSHPQPAQKAEDEEDLNTLVERILAGPLTTDVASAASSRDLAETQRTFRPSLQIPSPSVSPVSSSPRYHQPQRHVSSHSQQHHHQQQQRATSTDVRRGAAAAAAARHPAHHTTSGSGGATRAETSLARSAVGGLLHTSNGAVAAAAPSSMDAVVRRLTLWQERREAKRVQSVYEALEKEQEDCTFEPSINRLTELDSRSGSHSRPYHPQQRSSMSSSRSGRRAESGERARYEEDEETEESASVGPRYRQHYQQQQHRANSATAGSASFATSAEFVPSLLPPTQPIQGVDIFIERIRRAQEERDSVKAAAEAQRLRHYDPATFQRDVTVPEPFELGDTRPRRPPTSTIAVAGVPSPLTRLRGSTSAMEGMAGMYGLRVGATAGGGGGAAALTCSPSRVSLAPSGGAAGLPAATNRSPLANTLDPPSPRNVRTDYGYCAGGGGGGGVYASGTGYEEEEGLTMLEDRLTAENTFLSLAPQIREALLFDRQMEQQLHRATQSIRRGTV